VSQYDKLVTGHSSAVFVLFEKDTIETQANSAGIATVRPGLRPRRKIFLRDSVTFLVLLLATVALYAITSFLFRSFSTRRIELGREFALSGQKALRNGDPTSAIQDLRASLEYAPDETGNRLLLAEALARANHLEEARSYFLGMLDAQPADGFLNLQLARLARQQKEANPAVDYYRAAAVGNWTGDSIRRRFHVQLELADYLIELGRLPSAQAELLIAAADAPEDATVATTLGERFERAGDPSDALHSYQKAIKLNPEDADALYKAGRVAYQMGEFSEAARLLSTARRESSAEKLSEENVREEETLLESARRIQDLTLSSELPARDRVEHLLRALPIARARFQGCAARFNGLLPNDLQGLDRDWSSVQKVEDRKALLQDDSQQDALMKLIFETEEVTSRVCGEPSGDDALLLQLANAPH